MPSAAHKARFVGAATTGEPIISGEFIFWLVDSQGIPLPAVTDWMLESGIGFDVPAFIEAAHRSGNWTPIRLRDLLLDAYDGDERETVRRLNNHFIAQVYGA